MEILPEDLISRIREKLKKLAKICTLKTENIETTKHGLVKSKLKILKELWAICFN